MGLFLGRRVLSQRLGRRRVMLNWRDLATELLLLLLVLLPEESVLAGDGLDLE